jgi:tight adherence protein B
MQGPPRELEIGPLRLFLGTPAKVGAPVMALITSAIWFQRGAIYTRVRDNPSLIPAGLVGVLILTLIILASLWVEHNAQRRYWLQRGERLALQAPLAPAPWPLPLLERMPDPLEWIMGPFLRSPQGQAMAELWRDARMGERPSRYVLLLAGAFILGYLFGTRIGGGLLGVGLGVVFALFPRQWVHNRAQAYRRRFGEQLPLALDALAAGLSAGLSFPQAVDYAARELPDPVGGAFERLSRRMELGLPVEEAMQKMHAEHPDESLALVLDGISLQRQFGGDLVEMLEETARLLRERVELEREVRAITAQGRLSGWVVAALVPVSAAILLFTNPLYINVLFETVVGQALTVLALMMQLVGLWIISRLIRIRY